ncbi:ferritin-like domain-containing protein [Massilia kyonggiensis]|nr:ferritin-like domain-containing protein [Massilia kyonggiensis]
MDGYATDAFDVAELVPGFRPPPQPAPGLGDAQLAEADARMRHWRDPHVGPLVPGSDRHGDATCRMFRDTFNPYRPAVLDWPRLEPEVRDRIVALPIWDIAVQTEGKARLRMAAYAGTLRDPAMRDALALNAWEEQRHKDVLACMVAAYGIDLVPEPVQRPPRDPEWAYLVTGYSECIDSFFAFGLFERARRSGLFPRALVDTFEPVMQEECRHILLFANWAAWHRARLSCLRRVRFEAKVAAVWAFLAWERIGIARAIDVDGGARPQDNNFTLRGAQSVAEGGVGVRDLLALCLAENDRRFAGYDERLLRPRTVPRLARVVLRVATRFGRRR